MALIRLVPWEYSRDIIIFLHKMIYGNTIALINALKDIADMSTLCVSARRVKTLKRWSKHLANLNERTNYTMRWHITEYKTYLNSYVIIWIRVTWRMISLYPGKKRISVIFSNYLIVIYKCPVSGTCFRDNIRLGQLWVLIKKGSIQNLWIYSLEK